MFPFIKFIIRRLLFMLATIFVVSAMLYGFFVLFIPPEVRATAYIPPWEGRGNMENLIESTIEEYGLSDPYIVQYARWVRNLLQGDWGTSTMMNDEVLDILLTRTPATAELLIFSLLIFIPLGLVCGVWAGWKNGRSFDLGFRLTAFVTTSIPPFILGLMLLAIFYIGLYWFPTGRLSVKNKVIVSASEFRSYTGLLMVDGLLNGHPEVSSDALRHLVLPAFTLSLTYWATLGRVTRSAMIEEMHSDYVTTARSKGLRMDQVVWRHAFRNATIPGINSIALSAAMFLTNACIIEIIFGYPGISYPLTKTTGGFWFGQSPDVDMALGFAVYSILLVIPLIIVMDIIQALVDPRIREGIYEL